MREFLNLALSDAIKSLDKTTPKTKKDVAYIEIDNNKPIDISKFIKDKDIPEDAYFNTDYNGNVCICYEYDVPTTKKEQLLHKRQVFHDKVFPKLHNLLTSNRYKRIGFDSSLLKGFKNLNIYDAYLKGDIDIIEKYYSLFFKKID